MHEATIYYNGVRYVRYLGIRFGWDGTLVRSHAVFTNRPADAWPMLTLSIR
jgi:hypothetical protein